MPASESRLYLAQLGPSSQGPKSASVLARQRVSAFAGVFSACLARAHLVGECVESTLAGLPPYSDTWPVHPRVAEELSWRSALPPKT